MANRIVVDPISRIEGHLRIEAELDASNTITKAYSSGTMVRGLEIILKGRDPREAWAFTQRACGVCTTVHAFASIRSVEDALDIRIPKAANIVRNMMIAQQYIHDHVMHFYHLHALDWVDVVNALKADPKKTSEIQQSISPWPKSSPAYFAGVQQKVQGIATSGQLSIFANAYWGHPAYKLPPEINLLAVAHYLEALDWQSHVTKIHTIFGGKNPHPNFVVGGIPMPIDMNSDTALNMERLAIISDSIDKIVEFVDQVYIPDILAIAPFYKDYAAIGGGLGNFLTWGEFPGLDPKDTSKYLIPRVAIMNKDLANIIEPDPRDFEKMKEFIAHSWYKYSGGDEVGLHPWRGETELNFTGPKSPFKYLEVEQKYSWLKSPRWNEASMEVGPLARVLALYAKGHEQTKELVDLTLKKARRARYGGFLDPRPHSRTGDRNQGHRGLAARVLRRPHRGDQGGEHEDVQQRQVGSRQLALACRRVRLHGSSPRRARTLDRDREREDRELPACCPHHLERLAARP